MDSTISFLCVVKVSMDSIISLKTLNSHQNPKNVSTYSTFYNPHKPTRRQPISCSSIQDNNTKSVNPLSNNKTKRSALSFFESLIKMVDKTLVNFIDPPLHPSVDPSRVFIGNFSPVNELSPTECPVVDGEVPLSLNGVYIRNGPNPQHMPRGPLHLFEGDGMVHSLQLYKGRAVYACRYVKTYKFKLEREAGFPIFPNMLSGFYGLSDIFVCFVAVFRVLIGHINLIEGYGLANTSVAFFSGKLVALCESDLPYILQLKQDGDIETIGRWDFDKKLFSNMTAHPKTDIDTKETFAFKCSPIFPYLTFFSFDENGVKQKDVHICSIHHPIFIHDFAITKRFAIFPETQLAVAPQNLILGRGMPVVCDPSKVQRIGIIARYAKSDAEMRWFEIPGFNAMHVINAWENGDDEIVLVAPNSKSNILKSIDNLHFALEKVRINIKTGEITRKVLSIKNLEFGSINGSYIGKKNRYAYLGMGEKVPRMSGVVKMDLEMECEVSTRFYGAGCYGGEPLFVARNAKGGDDEDDGFVLSYIHDEYSGESKFIVMDAKSPCLDIVAAVKMPKRVPYGFHGLFVHEDHLTNNP
ncbi:hypothetical protein ACOSQ2_016228 [Xanthoceras sorbifolium]